MFNKLFQTKSFYFSQDYDLTRPFSGCIQRSFKKGDYEEKFYFNHAHTAKFRENGLDNLVQPFISGLVLQKVVKINQKTLNFILISRRDKSRSGVRFISRGADNQGNVSNFAETEQIISFMNEDYFEIFTYLQTRGSIPYLWKQTPSLKWSPKVLMEPNSMKNKSVFENHLNRIKKSYGDNHLINLIDKSGTQKKVGDYMSELVRQFQDQKIRYTWFDFHHECAKMQWHNLSKLIDSVLKSLQEYKFGQYRVFKKVSTTDPERRLS